MTAQILFRGHNTGLDARALQQWEQKRRHPDRATRVLLTVIDKEPKAVERALAKR